MTYAKLSPLDINTYCAGEASQVWDARYVGRQYIVSIPDYTVPPQAVGLYDKAAEQGWDGFA